MKRAAMALVLVVLIVGLVSCMFKAAETLIESAQLNSGDKLHD